MTDYSQLTKKDGMSQLSLCKAKLVKGAGSGIAVYRKTLVQRGKKWVSNKQYCCKLETRKCLLALAQCRAFPFISSLNHNGKCKHRGNWCRHALTTSPPQFYLCSILTSVPDLCFYLIKGIKQWFCMPCCEDMCTCICKWYFHMHEN